jgi:hypothetical protein
VTAETVGKTGVEMEALTGVSVALLTIYDMCKAVDRGMTMSDIRIAGKAGRAIRALACPVATCILPYVCVMAGWRVCRSRDMRMRFWRLLVLGLWGVAAVARADLPDYQVFRPTVSSCCCGQHPSAGAPSPSCRPRACWPNAAFRCGRSTP